MSDPILDGLAKERNENAADLLDECAEAVLAVATTAEIRATGRQQLCRKASDLYGIANTIRKYE